MVGAEFLVPAERRTASLDLGGYELGLFVAPEAPPTFVAELDVVDRGGRLFSGRGNWTEITIDQLLRSFDAGTLPGDPRGVALMRPGRGAGGVVAAWESSLVVWEVLGQVLTAYGLYELGQKLYRRITRGRKAVEENLADWRLRGAMTHRFLALLSRQPWHPETLSKLLDCTREDAQSTLELFGFRAAPDGRYHPGREGAEGFLWALAGRVRASYADSDPAVDALAIVLKAQLRELIKGGGSAEVIERQRQQDLPD